LSSKTLHREKHSPKLHERHHEHAPMFAPSSDCQVLIAGGMGQSAYQHATEAGLKVILTEEKNQLPDTPRLPGWRAQYRRSGASSPLAVRLRSLHTEGEIAGRRIGFSDS